MSGIALHKPARGDYQGSQLRLVSNRDEVEVKVQEHSTSPRSIGFSRAAPALQVTLACTLGVHDEAFSKEEVLVNSSLFPPGSLAIGTALRITALEADSPSRSFKPQRAESLSASQWKRKSG